MGTRSQEGRVSGSADKEQAAGTRRQRARWRSASETAKMPSPKMTDVGLLWGVERRINVICVKTSKNH